VITAFAAPSTFVAAVPQNFTETCDYCPAPENPYNASTPPYELLHTYLVGFPNNATQTESYWGNDNSAVTIPAGIPDQPQPPGGHGPLLEYYGHNYQVLRPTPQ
jgi:hypothetical protein